MANILLHSIVINFIDDAFKGNVPMLNDVKYNNIVYKYILEKVLVAQYTFKKL